MSIAHLYIFFLQYSGLFSKTLWLDLKIGGGGEHFILKPALPTDPTRGGDPGGWGLGYIIMLPKWGFLNRILANF